MKIGISSNALKHSGGLERYAMDLVRGLSEAGFRPAFFAKKIDASLPESRLVEPHRINVAFLPGKWRDNYFSWALSRVRHQAAVEVLIGCNRVAGSEIAICGGTHLGFLRAVGRREKWSDRRQIALERRQYLQAGVIVAHSELMRDELRSLYGIDDQKIRVLYPPVDSARFTPVDAEARMQLRRQFGFADHEVVLLFPSSSHVRKGLPLIEAALRDTPLPVIVAVAGRAPQRTSPRVRYLGYAKHIEDYYRAADFTILASLYEPFGLVGIESVMCGTPVIVPANIGCRPVLAEHARHVFEAGDAAHLQQVVAQALASRAARPPLGRDAVLYDVAVAAHVEQLLGLAKQLGGSLPLNA